MQIQEKRSIISIFTTLLIFVIYYFNIMGVYFGNSTDTTYQFRFWAIVILLLVPIMIVAKVILYVLYSITKTVATREPEPSFQTDERDKLIDLRAVRNFFYVFIGGFLLAMGAMVMEMNPDVMFNIFLFSLILAMVVTDLTKFYFYRKGI